MEIAKVAIIGAGPAGIAAAIQLKRCGITPLIFEKGEVGGLLRNANLVENYPGFPGGITGPELAGRLTRQFEDTAVPLIPDTVQNLGFEGGIFNIETLRQQYYAHYAVVASGTKPKKPTSPVISPGVESHIYYEVVQLSQVKGKKFAIIGAGDAAFDYALSLSKGNDVLILNRGTGVKCNPLLWNRVLATPTISYWPEVAIDRISKAGNGDTRDQVCLRSVNGIEFLADGVIFAVGRDPRLDFLTESVRQRQDELLADGKLFFVGDVKNKIFRQTAIAVGDGVLAAMVLSGCMDE